jgi:hypothetical protein
MDSVSQPTFLIGFPLIRSEFMDYDVDSSNTISYRWHDTSFVNFKCYVNGKELPSELDKDAHSYGPFKATVWRLFKTKLKAGIPIKVAVDYNDKWFYSCYYYIGTGALWSRAIESGRIVFDHSRVASTNFVPRTVEEDLRCQKYVGNGINVERHRDSLVYVLTNYRPKADETVNIAMFRFWSKSIAPDFMDTLKIWSRGDYGVRYGPIADFRYCFLWDTLTYVHKSNIVAIRDEMLKICGLKCESGSNDTDQCRTTDCFIYGGEYYQDSLSYREKSIINILTGRIDELKEEHDLEQKLQQKVTITKCVVTPINDPGKNTQDFIDSLKSRVKHAETELFSHLLPIYKYGCQGSILIHFNVDENGTMKTMKIRSTTNDQFAKTFCNVGIGMYGCNTAFISDDGPFSCDLEINIRVYQNKTPKPFKNFEPPPCKS